MVNSEQNALTLFSGIPLQKGGDIKFWEAECFKIDSSNKKIHCRSNIGTNLDGNGEFLVDYDYLVIAVGARSNTFNTPGVEENCFFLKVSLHYEMK
jgi:NADH:ubiquinone reductase (non-electrogenic)